MLLSALPSDEPTHPPLHCGERTATAEQVQNWQAHSLTTFQVRCWSCEPWSYLQSSILSSGTFIDQYLFPLSQKHQSLSRFPRNPAPLSQITIDQLHSPSLSWNTWKTHTPHIVPAVKRLYPWQFAYQARQGTEDVVACLPRLPPSTSQITWHLHSNLLHRLKLCFQHGLMLPDDQGASPPKHISTTHPLGPQLPQQ